MSPWKAFLNTKFKDGIRKAVQYNHTYNMTPNFKDPFYNEMFIVWMDINFIVPNDNDEICRQPLWNNSNLQSDGECFNYNRWKRNNINFVQDIVTTNGNIMSKSDLENKYGITCRLLEYERLLRATPKEWKVKLKKNKTLNKNYYVFHECNIRLQGVIHKLEVVSTKQIYWHFVDIISLRPTSEAKWNKKKITHRILACNYNLEIWNIRQNNRCDYCKEIDTIEHMLIYCKETYIFWQQIFK